MAIDAALMHDLARTVRVKSDTGKEEIMELVESCKRPGDCRNLRHRRNRTALQAGNQVILQGALWLR